MIACVFSTVIFLLFARNNYVCFLSLLLLLTNISLLYHGHMSVCFLNSRFTMNELLLYSCKYCETDRRLK